MKKSANISLIKNLGIIAGILVLIWVLATLVPYRIDLTSDKRYSLHPATVEVLESLEEPLEVEILLTGNLPGGMRRLQRSIEETIRTFNAYSSEKITFYYQDPLALPKEEQEDYIVGLSEYGINPTNLYVNEDGGQKSKLIFPGVIIRNAEFETGSLLLRGEMGMGPDQVLNQSVENLEFELINGIRKLISKQAFEIGLAMGQGELAADEGFGIVEALADNYEVYKVPLEQAKKPSDLDPFKIMIVSGPKEKYTETEIYLLDQYLMNGGNIIFLIDALAYDMAQAGGEGTVAMPFENGLDQLLFRYGVRVNKDLIQDMNFGRYPVMAGNFGDQQQLVPLAWPFFVLAGKMAPHPITKGLDQVMFKFSSSLDTVKADGVKKTPLIFSSDFSKKSPAPVRLAFVDMENEPDLNEFGLKNLPLLYLLEGNFTSFFKNRFLPDAADKTGFKESGSQGKVIVAGTGSLFQSDLTPTDGNPLPLGQDPFSNVQYANRQLLLNAISYLVEPEGIIATRTKQFQIRPLNKIKVQNEKSKWQVINILVPVVLFSILGMVWISVKKRTFSKRS
ncbi:gliding motility-associated ABC transporter substrate-binding protein GldG [Aquiflexum gelatinilyticum]|uniref:Gliding motility-associated ABC transporter substrate-binding protein GldG n=1 Tax=Aquiflexum gelatinilyticum TaxID=2961943 RepID=A0A9X2P6S8_9BACT|nr:gliding motility-associated ABC transporter substrate-binding protein GldG [Aquiflexum gelatinilyticum]MCR9016462.1 gliding motility-associated ABC transporter substrate-binding protein GldG [Aquiflexum gelatinilyticum]